MDPLSRVVVFQFNNRCNFIAIIALECVRKRSKKQPNSSFRVEVDDRESKTDVTTTYNQQGDTN